MKGTFFQRPVEFNLRVDGETWAQGDPITGSLTVKNHGSEPLPLSDVHVRLAHGLLRKVRLKAPDAFKLIDARPFAASVPLAPGQEASFDWKFETDRNCPITDNVSSLFVLYGRGTATEAMGQLELAIEPFALISEFIKAVTIQFRFVQKARRAGKGFVEVKLAPPDSQAFATLDHLALSFSFKGDTLEVGYKFNVKKLEATAATIDMKTKRKELVQTFEPTQYRTAHGRVNHDHLEAAIKDALGMVEAKTIF